jgi:general secretion pathway protein A
MYEAHWNLACKPFEPLAEPSFAYPCEAQQGPLAKLHYALSERRGSAVLSGESGVGKTHVVRHLAQTLGDSVVWIQIVFPQLTPAELCGYLAARLTGEDEPGSAAPSLDRSLRKIESRLLELDQAGRRVVLCIDEAHLIDDGRTFEALRLLTNFTAPAGAPISLLLSGLPSLGAAVQRRGHLADRITQQSLLRPWTADETHAYVQHRLHAAGGAGMPFTTEALDVLHAASLGTPRRINRLADLALVVGYAEDRTEIDAGLMSTVAEEAGALVA